LITEQKATDGAGYLLVLTVFRPPIQAFNLLQEGLFTEVGKQVVYRSVEPFMASFRAHGGELSWHHLSRFFGSIPSPIRLAADAKGRVLPERCCSRCSNQARRK
jgi:hypothetical protein